MSRIKPQDFDSQTNPTNKDTQAEHSVGNVVWSQPTTKPQSEIPTQVLTNFSNPNLQNTSAQEFAQPPTQPSSKIGWILSLILSVFFVLVIGIISVGWYIDHQAMVRRESQLNIELGEEKEIRRTLAEKIPMVITDIQLRNENNGEAISDYSTEFKAGTICYLSYYATVINTSAGERSLNGDLFIKYIYPSGTLSRGSTSPDNFSFTETINISSSVGRIGKGWGNEECTSYQDTGEYRIEFWWNGQLVGHKSFTVRY